MASERLNEFMQQHGQLESHKADQIFHSQDFKETLFMLKSGYAKRYQISKDNKRVIESIYGPGHAFPLTQLYKKLFSSDHNQEGVVYIYQSINDIEIWRINADEIVSALENDNRLYADLFREAGIRIKSNIDRLASNALEDDYKKVAHQIKCLADEFGKVIDRSRKKSIKIQVPLKPLTIAEQLNISAEIAEAMLSSLCRNKLISIKNDYITILDLDMLKDIYM